MACTTILVGKNATFDGSTFVARNEDSGSDGFCSKKLEVINVKGKESKYDTKGEYVSVLSKVRIKLPDNPMRTTIMPNALDNEGVWGAFGVNEKNVSMTATETITANDRILSVDPLVVYEEEKEVINEKGEKVKISEKIGGIGEEDMVSLVLPFINSAKEGVIRLGKLLKEYGTYEMNGIAFQDENEIWWFETIGGHNFIAVKVPDDSYIVMPNQLGIDKFDFYDALHECKNNMCSDGLKELVENYNLSLAIDSYFNPRFAFGTEDDSDLIYNTPRAWSVQRYFAKDKNDYDGEKAKYKPTSFYLPFSLKPYRKITPTDIKYVLSDHYQNTPYDPYGNDEKNKNKFRPIGVNRNSFMGFVRIRPNKSDNIKALNYIAMGSNVFNEMVPLYSNVNDIPNYFKNTTKNVSTESFYWANRLIGALADANFKETSIYIERYSKKMKVETNKIILEYDEKAKGLSYEESSSILQEANEKIAKLAKELTDDLLDKVLFVRSMKMKNAFSRSDA